MSDPEPRAIVTLQKLAVGSIAVIALGVLANVTGLVSFAMGCNLPQLLRGCEHSAAVEDMQGDSVCADPTDHSPTEPTSPPTSSPPDPPLTVDEQPLDQESLQQPAGDDGAEGSESSADSEHSRGNIAESDEEGFRMSISPDVAIRDDFTEIAITGYGIDSDDELAYLIFAPEGAKYTYCEYEYWDTCGLFSWSTPGWWDKQRTLYTYVDGEEYEADPGTYRVLLRNTTTGETLEGEFVVQ